MENKICHSTVCCVSQEKREVGQCPYLCINESGEEDCCYG